jgi:hypothetical protein
MTLVTGLVILGVLWVLGAAFIVGLCITASRRRPREVVIPPGVRRIRARQNGHAPRAGEVSVKPPRKTGPAA